MNGPAPEPRPRRRARRWLFALGVAVVFAGALELAARAFIPRADIPVLIAPLENRLNNTPPTFFRPHPTLFWELLPDVRFRDSWWGDVTNSDGLRMRREVGAKDGRLRVACFGDSCTYGLGLPVDDAWPSVLAADPTLDVINAGVPGYSSFQGARSADMRCPDWKPDVVVVEFGINDALTWMQFDRDKVVAMTDVERAPHVRVDFLLRRSALVGWLASLAGVPPPRPVPPDLLASARPPRDAVDKEHETAVRLMRYGHDRMPARVPPDEFRANLLRIAAHAPRAVVILWPRRRLLDASTPDAMSPERLAPFDAALRSTAGGGVDVLDLSTPLLTSGLTADQAFIDEVHGTRALSEIVAAQVRAKLRGR